MGQTVADGDQTLAVLPILIPTMRVQVFDTGHRHLHDDSSPVSVILRPQIPFGLRTARSSPGPAVFLL